MSVRCAAHDWRATCGSMLMHEMEPPLRFELRFLGIDLSELALFDGGKMVEPGEIASHSASLFRGR